MTFALHYYIFLDNPSQLSFKAKKKKKIIINKSVKEQVGPDERTFYSLISCSRLQSVGWESEMGMRMQAEKYLEY